MKIGQGRWLLKLDVATAFHSARRAARNQNRQVAVVMHIGIPHAAPIKVERMIQQRAVALRRGLQLPKKLGEQRHVELIDLGHPRNLFRIVAVMRQRMMRIRNASLRIGPVAGFARKLEGNHARDIALQRQHLEIEHQSSVVRVGGGNTDRPIQIRQRVVLGIGFRPLNAALHLADRFKILAHPRAIGWAEFSLEPRDILIEPIEQAGPFPQRGLAVCRAAAFAEESFKDDPRMRFGR